MFSTLAKDLFVELERWIQKIRLVFNNSTRRTEFSKWQTGEYYTHSICWMEYSSLCSLFISCRGSLKCGSQKKRVLRNRKIGPRSVLVHQFWSSWKKNSVFEWIEEFGAWREFWVFIVYWNNFGAIHNHNHVPSIYTLYWHATSLNDYFVYYFIKSYSVYATKV